MNTNRLLLTIALATALCPALASAQNLFVSCWDGNIYEFSTNGAQSTFATDLGHPRGLAFDSVGNLFVAGYGGTLGGSNYIYEFTPDGTRSTVAFASAATSYFSGLAIDNMGNLFVAEEASQGHIYEFATNGTQSVFAAGLIYPRDLAFDKSGNLFVQDSSGAGGTTYEFTPDGAQSTFVSGTGPGSYLAFDDAGNLFVAAGGTGNIYEFTTNGVQSTFASGYGAMAFDRKNNLFVTGTILLGGITTNYVYEFAPNGTRSTFASLPSEPEPGFLAVQPALASMTAAPVPLGITTVGSLPVVVWPASATNCVLQMTTNLASGNWVTVTNGILFSGLQITNAPLGAAFFRLH